MGCCSSEEPNRLYPQSKQMQQLLVMDYKLSDILTALEKTRKNDLRDDVKTILKYINVNNQQLSNKNQQLPKQKLLFLDVDGVLNSAFNALNYTNITSLNSILFLECLNMLKNIITETGCFVVLSSTWRLIDDMKKVLFKAMEYVKIDYKSIYIGETPNYTDIISKKDNRRTFEIKGYLNQCIGKTIITHWCAIDDLMLDKGNLCKKIMNGHFVHTNSDVGLTEINVKSVIDILNRV